MTSYKKIINKLALSRKDFMSFGGLKSTEYDYSHKKEVHIREIRRKTREYAKHKIKILEEFLKKSDNEKINKND